MVSFASVCFFFPSLCIRVSVFLVLFKPAVPFSWLSDTLIPLFFRSIFRRHFHSLYIFLFSSLSFLLLIYGEKNKIEFTSFKSINLLVALQWSVSLCSVGEAASR